MKKENRQMAQVRKAQEKKKQEQMAKIKKIGMIAVPILVFVVLILILYKVSSGGEDTSGTGNDTTVDTTTDDTSTATTLNTDTSLVVEDGDTVNIDYIGTIDGVEFNGGSTGGAGTDLTIGSGMYIDGFEDQLIGANVGDTVEVVCTFPDNYGAAELAGQEAVFTTTINGIYK